MDDFGPPPGPWGPPPPPPGGPWGPPPPWGWGPPPHHHHHHEKEEKHYEPDFDNYDAGDENTRPLTVKEDGVLGFLFGPKFSKSKKAKKKKKEDLKQKEVKINSRTVSSFNDMIDEKENDDGPIQYISDSKKRR